MFDHPYTNPGHDEAAITTVDLTALEVATYIVSALIGMAIVGVIVVLMLQ